MELKDLQELRDAIESFVVHCHLGASYDLTDVVNYKLMQLRKTMSKVNLNLLKWHLQQFNVHEINIIGLLESVVLSCSDFLIQYIEHKYFIEISYKVNMKDDYQYIDDLSRICADVLAELRERQWIDPTREDENSYYSAERYFSGYYKGIELGEFIKGYIINGLSPKEAIRRLNYLIGRYTNDEQTKCVLEAELQKQKEKQSESTEATNDEPLQKPSASPAPIAPNVDKPEKPDFLSMRSFQPEKELSLHNLYEFLIDEGVIRDVDEALFTDCIKHAYFNSLWDKGKRNQLKCVIRHLKDNFDKLWIENVAENLGKSKKVITSMNRDSFGDFENKLRDIL